MKGDWMGQDSAPSSTIVSTQCVVKSGLELGKKTLSPGSFNGCRTAARLDDEGMTCDAFVASGTKVYNAKIPLQQGEVDRGKGDLLIPRLVQGCITEHMERMPHRAEVQSLAIGSKGGGGGEPSLYQLLGSVDAKGQVVVSLLPPTDNSSSSSRRVNAQQSCRAHESSHKATHDDHHHLHLHLQRERAEEDRSHATHTRTQEGHATTTLAYSVVPPDTGAGECGWAGLAFSPSDPCLVAAARSFAQSLDVYDVGMHVRTMRTLQPPSSITFIPDMGGGGGGGGTTCLLAVTEGSQLSVWDMRAGERGGCVERVLGAFGGQPLYASCALATATAASPVVAVGGAERAAVIFDTRKWRARGRWNNCIKYEITGLAFSSLDPRLIYVSGLDHEVVCGRWGDEGMRGDAPKMFSFKGDSRWYGVHKVIHPVDDVLGGLCESGNYFVARMQSES